MSAIDAKKVTSFAVAAKAMELKADSKPKYTNVKLNFETGAIEVRDKKDTVVKTFTPAKGTDAVQVINTTEDPENLKIASGFLKDQRNALAHNAGEFEAEFSEKQDDLLKSVGLWRESARGSAASRDLSIQIGRLQYELKVIENKLRGAQYKQRRAVAVEGIKRRTFIPLSFDDRVMPHPVYKLLATQSVAGLRILPHK
jgi:hypothetical protein